MPIKEKTIDHLFKAIHKVGEPEVENVLQILQSRDSVIDKVTDLVCARMNINKSFLFIKNNRGDLKNNAILAIIFILKQYDIATVSIKNYFKSPYLRVNEIRESFYELSENVRPQKELKVVISSLITEAEPIFAYYFVTKKI